MKTITNWVRMLVAAMALTAFAPAVGANAAADSPVATHRAGATDLVEKQPAGSPEMGVLVIIGVIAFLVFVAWIFSRVGDDSLSRGDHSLI